MYLLLLVLLLDKGRIRAGLIGSGGTVLYSAVPISCLIFGWFALSLCKALCEHTLGYKSSGRADLSSIQYLSV